MWKGRLNETCPPNYVNNTNVGREVQGTQQCVIIILTYVAY